MSNKQCTAVVTGPKSIWIPKEGGGRRLADIGEEITVSEKTLRAFPDRLKLPEVAKAEDEARQAEAAAEEAKAAGVTETPDAPEKTTGGPPTADTTEGTDNDVEGDNDSDAPEEDGE